MQKPLAVTAGEPAGIGYDILVQVAQDSRQQRLLIFADPKVLRERAQLLQLPLEIVLFKDFSQVTTEKQQLTVWPVPCFAPVEAGKLNVQNAHAVLQGLREAAQTCLKKETAALVTLPVHKGVINELGLPFSGHTEFFAKMVDVEKVVMMLAAGGCRVALVTTHLPLRKVADAVTAKNLHETISILTQHLQQFHRIKKPRLLVMGLNPHAGEQGHMGSEEIDIIIPVLELLKQSLSVELIGPLPADTLFQKKYLEHADAIVAMYHDQGLAPLKALHFGEIVNVTCGLPFVRTSVDHGVALDVAGTGKAEVESFLAAVALAEEMSD